ncbi:hypothetical protein ACOME3_004434 [Neoechinorhynchus agilis]
MAEWLRRQTRNLMGFSRTGSNPVRSDGLFNKTIQNIERYANVTSNRHRDYNSRVLVRKFFLQLPRRPKHRPATSWSVIDGKNHLIKKLVYIFRVSPEKLSFHYIVHSSP